MAFVLPSLANNDVVRELAVEDDVLDTLEADFLHIPSGSVMEDWSAGSTGDHVVILLEDGEGEVNDENVIRTEEMYGG